MTTAGLSSKYSSAVMYHEVLLCTKEAWDRAFYATGPLSRLQEYPYRHAFNRLKS